MKRPNRAELIRFLASILRRRKEGGVSFLHHVGIDARPKIAGRSRFGYRREEVIEQVVNLSVERRERVLRGDATCEAPRRDRFIAADRSVLLASWNSFDVKPVRYLRAVAD